MYRKRENRRTKYYIQEVTRLRKTVSKISIPVIDSRRVMILARDQSQKFSIFPRNTNVGGVFASSLANLSTFEQSNVSSSNETRISRNLGGENVLTSHARSIGDRGKVNRRQRLEWLEKPIACFADCTLRNEPRDAGQNG